MAELLTKKGWHAELKKIKGVKKTGLGDVLSDYEKAVKKKNDNAAALMLVKVIDKAKQVKKDYPKQRDLAQVLDRMTKMAEEQRGKITGMDQVNLQQEQAPVQQQQPVPPPQPNPQNQQDEEDDPNLDAGAKLAAALKRAKKASRDSAANFLLVRKNPLAGLVVSKRAMTADSLKIAKQMAGGNGPRIDGRVYGEGQLFVFEMAEEPEKALGKSIRKAAKVHAAMKIKILLRGPNGDMEIPDEDEEPDDDVATVQPSNQVELAGAIGEKWRDEILRMKRLPADQRAEAFKKALPSVKADINQIKGMEGLTPQEKTIMEQQIMSAMSSLSYPTEQQWKAQIANIVKVENAKRDTLLSAIQTKIAATQDKINQNRNLSDEDRAAEIELLQRMSALAAQVHQQGAMPAKAAARPTFPSESAWKTTLDKVEQMAQDARPQAAEKVAQRIAAVRAQVRNAATAGDPFTEELTVLQRAEERARALQHVDMRGRRVIEDPVVARTFRDIDAFVEAARDLPIIKNQEFQTRYQQLKTVAENGQAGRVTQQIEELRQMAVDAAKIAARERYEAEKRQEYAQIDAVMAKNTELLRKSTFVPGSVEAIAKRKKELAIGGSFKPVMKAMLACEGKMDAKNTEKVMAECQKYMDRFENKLSDKDREKPAMQKKYEIAKQAFGQAKLLTLVEEYDSLGHPSKWSEEDASKAAELQAKLFFEEGRVMHREGNSGFGAIPLDGVAPSDQDPASAAEDGQRGANESWWVKRREPVHKMKAGGNADELEIVEEDAERLYIFKPADLEADIIKGLPAGSGAPREVFAKDLSDLMMREGGLDIGVCSTTLANIEGDLIMDTEGNLGDAETQRMGSMQKLAATGKSISKLSKEDPNFGNRIDKENYDQIILFDMIIGNFDRHGGNTLVEDPGNGQMVKMVPIDHGTSMADAETCQANQGRLIGPQNFMLKQGFPQAGEPMSEEVLRKIRLMDPKAVAQGLRESSERLMQQQGETGHGLTEDQIKRMEKTILFLQKAGDSLSIRGLFWATAMHAETITDTPDDQMEALAQQLAGEINDSLAGVSELSSAINILEIDSEKLNHSNDFTGVQTWLKNNGWFVGRASAELFDEIRNNPRRFAKLIANGQPNPAVAQALQDLHQEAGGGAFPPDYDYMSVPEKQAALLRKKVEHQRAQANAIPADERDQAIEAGGGVDLYNRVCEVIPNEQRTRDRADEQPPMAEVYRVCSDITKIRNLTGLNDDQILDKIANTQGINSDLIGNYLELMRWSEGQGAHLAAADQIDEAGLAAARQQSFNQMLTDGQMKVGRLVDERHRNEFAPVLQEADALARNGLVNEAQPKLVKVSESIDEKYRASLKILNRVRDANQNFFQGLLNRAETARANKPEEAARWVNEINTLNSNDNDAYEAYNYEEMVKSDDRTALENRFNTDFPIENAAQ